MSIRTLFAALAFTFSSSTALAADEMPTPALSGYDAVAYQTEGEAVRGSGFHVSKYRGRTYLFKSKEHKALFDENPKKYIPAYNGWCAYGVAVGKKFHADPTVFAVIDGKTYLNLDKDIQKKWNEDRSGHIKKGDQNWRRIARSRADKL